MIPPLMMCKQMLINDIKNKFTELAPNIEILYNTMQSKKSFLDFECFFQDCFLFTVMYTDT